MTLQSLAWQIAGENRNSKGHMHLSVHCTLIHNSQDMHAT